MTHILVTEQLIKLNKMFYNIVSQKLIIIETYLNKFIDTIYKVENGTKRRGTTHCRKTSTEL